MAFAIYLFANIALIAIWVLAATNDWINASLVDEAKEERLFVQTAQKAEDTTEKALVMRSDWDIFAFTDRPLFV